MSLMVMGIVILLGYLASRHRLRFDATKIKEFSLSPQTRKILQALDREVKITCFFEEGGWEEERVKDLLSQYTYRSPRIKVQFIDPGKRPGIAREYEIDEYGTVVVEVNGNRKKIYRYHIFGWEYQGYERIPQFKGEQQITQAILQLTKKEKKKIYFLTGHGEKDPSDGYSRIKERLRGENYEVSTLNLLEKREIPEDASLLIIAGPRRSFSPKEIELIKTYQEKGDPLFLLLDPLRKGLPQLKSFLAEEWGLELHEDLVIDPARNYFFDPLSPIPVLSSHSITESLIKENLGIVLPQARSMDKKEILPEGVFFKSLLTTSGDSWGETDLSSPRAKFEKNKDIKGPLTVGSVLTKEKEGKKEEKKEEMKMVILGDSDLANNNYLQIQGNLDLFMNVVAYLMGEEETISIRPKTPEFERIYLSASQTKLIFYLSVFVIPLGLLGTGGFIWLRRRKK